MSRRTLILCILFIFTTGGLAAQTTVYIDPGYTSGDSDGSLEKPYTSWNEISISAGNTYLQKRGTTCAITERIPLARDTTIGAYGEGERPVIHFTPALPGNYGVLTAKNSSSGSIYRNVTIRDLHIIGPEITTIILVEGYVGDVLIDNCHLDGGVWGIRLLCWDVDAANRYYRILNCEIHNTGDDGIFVYSTPNVEIGYCHIYDVNQKYFTGPQPPSQSTAPGDPVQFAEGSSNAWIHHNILDKSGTEFKFALIFQQSASTQEPVKALVEYNILIGQGLNTAATVYIHPMIDVTFRGNVFSNAPQGIYNASSPGLVRAYGNVFYNVNWALTNNSGQQSEFYNNLMVDCGGVRQTDFKAPTHILNNLLYTPTTSSATDWLIRYDPKTNPPASYFSCDHNLIWPDHPVMWIFNLSPYNSLEAWQDRPEDWGAHSMVADPFFKGHAAGIPADIDPDLVDYRLLPDSPARDAGLAIPGATTEGDDHPDIGPDLDLLYSTGVGPQGAYPLLAFFDGLSYGPFEVINGTTFDTGDWLGRFDSVPTAPWLFSQALQRFVLLPEDQLDSPGGWLFLTR